MIGSVARAPMSVAIGEVRGEHLVDQIEQIVVAPRPGLQQRQPGGGVGTEDLDDAIASLSYEAGDPTGDVEGHRSTPGFEFDQLTVHRANLAGTAGGVALDRVAVAPIERHELDVGFGEHRPGHGGDPLAATGTEIEVMDGDGLLGSQTPGELHRLQR